jgi:hypothetical protein
MAPPVGHRERGRSSTGCSAARSINSVTRPGPAAINSSAVQIMASRPDWSAKVRQCSTKAGSSSITHRGARPERSATTAPFALMKGLSVASSWARRRALARLRPVEMMTSRPVAANRRPTSRANGLMVWSAPGDQSIRAGLAGQAGQGETGFGRVAT